MRSRREREERETSLALPFGLGVTLASVIAESREHLGMKLAVLNADLQSPHLTSLPGASALSLALSIPRQESHQKSARAMYHRIFKPTTSSPLPRLPHVTA